MADLTVQADVVVNAEGAEAAFTRVGDKATQMAANMQQAGARAGKAVDQIGEIAKSQGDKFTRAESAIVASIKRVTLEAAKNQQALEKIGDIQFNIAAKGLDPSKFAGMLNVTRQVAEETRALSAAINGTGAPALDKMGISAAQTAAALRGVPAQFTDIITSLQGGQAPMTVLLQQGGQLKDMFGGVGNATKALGGYVLGLVNPFTIAAAAAGSLGYAYAAGAGEVRAFDTALTASGNRLGLTSGQLQGIAADMTTFGLTQGRASESLIAFANAGVQGAAGLRAASSAAIGWEKATGEGIDKTAEKFAQLRKAPLETTLKLNEGLGYVTESLYKQIKALEDSGKATAAADLAQNAFADTLQGRSNEIIGNLGSIERGWDAIKNAAKRAWDSAKGIGRAETLEDQIAAVQKLRNDTFLKNRYDTTDIDKQLAGMTKRLLLQRDSAQINAQSIVQAEALAKWDKQGLEFLDKKSKMEREIAKARGEGAEAGLKQAEIEKRIADIKEKYKETPKNPKVIKADSYDTEAIKAYLDAIKDFGKIADDATGKTLGFSKAQERLREVMASPAFSAFNRRKQEEVIMAASIAIDAEGHAAALKELAAEREKEISSYQKSAQSANEKAQAIEDEVALYGKTKEAITELTVVRLLDEKARQMSYGDDRAVSAIDAEITAIKRLAKAQDSLSVLDDGKKAAKAIEDEWKRTSDSIERSLTDSLMRGWESGKGMWESFRDYITNSAKSWVIKIAVQPIMGLVNGIAGSIGIPGAQAASGSGLFGNLGGIGSALGSFGGTIATGFMNTLSGSGMMAGLESAGAMMGSGFMAQGLGMAAGALGPLALGIGALSALSNAMQYKITPNGGALVANVGASGASAVANRTDFTQTGGLFGGGTTQNSEWANADAGTTAYIDAAVKAVSSGNLAYAKALGLSGEALEGYTKQLTINTSGMDAAAAKAAIDSAIILFSNDQAQAAFGDSISAFAKEGEKAGETLARLATDLNSVNAWASTFGVALLEVSVMGAAAAATLVDAFGGLDAMNNSLSTFYKNYYTEEEQRQKTLQGVQTSLAANDISVSMDQLNNATIEGVRAWVDAAKALYDAGVFTAAQLAAAVSAANDIAGIAKENSTKKDAAEQAPVVAQEPNFGGTTGMGSSAGAGSTSGANPLDGIRTWLEDRRRSDASGLDIFTQKANAWATFQMQLVLSKAGDQTALGRITKDADVLLAAIDKTASSSFEQRLATAKVESQVGSLLNQKPEQLIVKAVDTVNNTLLDGFAALTGQGGIVSGGPLTGSLPVKVQTAGNVQQRTTVQSSFQSAPTTYSADPVMLPLLSGSPAKGDATNLATAMASVKELLDLIKANTESGAISNAKVARILDRVITSDDAIATQVIMPTGTYVPTRAV